MSVENWFCGEYSEAIEYLDACEKAISDENIFNSFKSIRGYQHILEHTSEDQGRIYANEIIDLIDFCKLDKKEVISKSKLNDLIGSPNLYNYEEFGLISPSTLRYLLFVLRIKKLAKNKQLYSFLDIGGGYGGMSLLAKTFLGCEKIYLNDLKQALKLQKKYLNTHEINSNCFEKIEDLKDEKINLCVSTFAFSELTKKQREKIIENIFPNCEMIYLVCNFINSEMFYDSEIFDFAENNYEVHFVKELHMNHLCSAFFLTKKP